MEIEMLADLKCTKCGEIYEDKVVFSGEEIPCEKCGTICDIIPVFSGTFRLKYDNSKDICSWAAEGYNASQYHSANKKLCKKNIFTYKQ